jgi:hypothetical protein
MLVVKVDENGKLSLNKIETGAIDDLTILSEKPEAIFDSPRSQGLMKEKSCLTGKANQKQNEIAEPTSVICSQSRDF